MTVKPLKLFLETALNLRVQAIIFLKVKLYLLIIRIASVFALLLSILISLGFPLLPMALFRNFCADPFILRLVSKKSTVFPCLSTARYKYLSLPPTLMFLNKEVSKQSHR